MKAIITLCLLAVFVMPVSAFAGDIEGGSDHPMISRYKGAEIIGYSASDYGELTFALGSAYEAGFSDYQLRDSKTVEGRVTRILYLTPEGTSTIQAYRNYEKAYNESGFKTLFTCSSNKECGWYSWFVNAQTLGGLRSYALQLGDDFRYLSARLKRREGDVYVSMLVYEYDSVVIGEWRGRTMVELNIVEVEPMEEGLVTVDADALAKAIREEGHVAVHQIFFDSGSADVKPESKPALDEIARMLKDDPSLNVIVVGHTDNVGGLEYNTDLSKRRAKAVTEYLKTGYGIKGERLGAGGVGFLAPIATNRTKEGRAMNRRVEIIEQ